MSDRIKLAEALGWRYVEAYGTQSGPIYGKLPAGGGLWEFPGDGDTRKHTKREPPDPFTDANDCEALIEFLRDDYRIEIDLPHHDTTDCSVRFIWAHGRSKYWTGDDWKQGVCELALKVLK